VNEREARKACGQLAAEHPDRDTHRWHPRQEAGGSWAVVKIALAPSGSQSSAETRAEARPPTGDDPRSAAEQNLGPNIGPGI